MTAGSVHPASPTPLGPYSPSVLSASTSALVFVSGQLPFDHQSGLILNQSISEQTRTALRNALQVAEAAGAAPQDVLKVTLYTTDLSQIDAINHAYTEVMGPARPARTTVEVSRLYRGAMIEVDLIAALPAAAAQSALSASNDGSSDHRGEPSA